MSYDAIASDSRLGRYSPGSGVHLALGLIRRCASIHMLRTYLNFPRAPVHPTLPRLLTTVQIIVFLRISFTALQAP